MNNGPSKASNEADVQRYKAFYDETGKHLKAGTYTVTLYSEGYEPLKAEVKVKADADRTATVDEADFAAGKTTVTLSKALPSDFDADYSFTVNGKASDFFTHENGKITWNANASEIPSGTYQLVIHDNSSKYADITAQIKLNVYAYASVPYDEYWKSEGVYLDGSDWKASSDEVDRTDEDGNQEHDKGAFDAVSRATQGHGRHLGSFQQDVKIYTKDNNEYTPLYWIDSDRAVISADKTVTLDENNVKDYKIYGIKYVPVKVAASDFAAFSKKYTVTQNGETLSGGYNTEKNLNAYSGLVAEVKADTNGLKAVTKKKDGTFTFGARQTGKGSGIKDQKQKTADSEIVATARDYVKAKKFGAHLRVDLTNPKNENDEDKKNAYGPLGDNMQTVVWKYYGNGNTVLATYGTKFAADDWIHKSSGIQLGLTDSKRFKLRRVRTAPGKWKITIYALGYSDSTFTVEMKKDNVAEKITPMTDDQKAQLTQLQKDGKALIATAPNADKLTPAESKLKQHIEEKIPAMLAKTDATESEAEKLITKVKGYIEAVQDERDNQSTVETKTITGTIYPKDDEDDNIKAPYNFSFKVTLKNGIITSISNDTTDAGDNSTYWEWATTKGHKNTVGLFTSLIGKNKDTVDSVDAVSGATVSSNAIKKAVKSALGAND